MHKTKPKLNPSFLEDWQTDVSYGNLSIYIHKKSQSKEIHQNFVKK